ncbi:MAG: hypothetical protein OSJ72_10110 [Lachnospiraceae bacterium]|nr:hypothetical protein [Lachnospiraceae bacterium]
MENCVKDLLHKKGYKVNEDALSVIRECDDWYANRPILEFHNRKTVQGQVYDLERMNFAKRCCSDDANLCEVVEINAGKGEQGEVVRKILEKNRFDTQYRRQLERVPANGTAACYIRLDNATIYDDGHADGGEIRLNYVDAMGFMPLTVENGDIVEAACSGNTIVSGKKQTTLVIFLKKDELYKAETHVFDEYGKELEDRTTVLSLGDVKPFAVMRNAEVNNLDNMDGYGLPKLLGAIPVLKALDLAFNVLFRDLDKADKLILINELLCQFGKNGEVMTPNEQAKKLFVLLGEKLPDQKELIQEYNPSIRIEELTKTIELLLSLLSMMFGYGTKKYSFENGNITTATEFVLSRQDAMQELNRQRHEAAEYIQGICKAVMWFSNTFHGTSYNVDEEVMVDFDDGLITDKEAELERKRNDAVTFEIKELLEWYLQDAYNVTPDEAKKMIEQRDAENPDEDEEEQD